LDDVVAALRALTGQCRQWAVPPGRRVDARPAFVRPLSTLGDIARCGGRGLQKRERENELR
jgi:hypothetical protein